MSKTLGQMIGKIVHNFTITNHTKTAKKLPMRLTFDFTTASDIDIKNWLASDRCIAWAKPARNLSLEELEGCNYMTVLATDCAKKVVSREERIAQFVNSGMPLDVATVAVDNPNMFASIMEKASEEISSDTDDDETSDDE